MEGERPKRSWQVSKAPAQLFGPSGIVYGFRVLLKLSGFIRIYRCHGFKCMNTLC